MVIGCSVGDGVAVGGGVAVGVAVSVDVRVGPGEGEAARVAVARESSCVWIARAVLSPRESTWLHPAKLATRSTSNNPAER